MNLTTDEAQFLIGLQKRMRNQTLRIPARGEKESYPASDLENLRDFIFRMRIAGGEHGNHHNASYLLLYEHTPLLRVDTAGQGLHTNADGTTIPPPTPRTFTYTTNRSEITTPILFLPPSLTLSTFSKHCATF